jgi:hypothetical protein
MEMMLCGILDQNTRQLHTSTGMALGYNEPGEKDAGEGIKVDKVECQPEGYAK